MNNQTVIAHAALYIKNLFVNLSDYPIKGQGTSNGVQYSYPAISTDTAGEYYELLLYKSEDHYPNTSGHIIHVEYNISFEIKAANTTADLTWKIQARDKDGSWINMCTEREETDIGTSYAAKAVKGYLDIQSGISKMPFEIRLVFKSNAGTAEIVDEWTETAAVNFDNTTAILAVYYKYEKLIAGLQITGTSDKACPYYNLATSTWVDTGQVKGSGNVRTVRCFAEFDGKLWLGNECQINHTTTGTSWQQVYNQPDNIYSLLAFPAVGGNFYAAQGNGKVWVSAAPATSENTWAKTTHDPTSATCCYALIEFAGKIYVGTTPNGKVFSTANPATTAWVGLSLSGATHVYCLAKFDATGDGDELYAGTNAGKVFKLNAAESAWVEVEDFAGVTNVRSLVVIGDYIYAGTEPDGDIYFSSDGTTWTAAKNLLGATVIYGMAQTNDKVFVGANGNKLWYSDLKSGEGIGQVKNDTVIKIVGRIT